MERTFSRSLDFNALLVSTRAPCELTLSVTPECAGVRTSTLHKSTPTFKCLRSSARFPFTSACIGHRQTKAGPGRPRDVMWEIEGGTGNTPPSYRARGEKALFFGAALRLAHAGVRRRNRASQERTSMRRPGSHKFKLNGFSLIAYARKIWARKLLRHRQVGVHLFVPKRAGRQGDLHEKDGVDSRSSFGLAQRGLPKPTRGRWMAHGCRRVGARGASGARRSVHR